MNIIDELKAEVAGFADPEKREQLMGYFKTGPGQYGEGDRFLGVTVPQLRSSVKRYYRKVGLEELALLIKDEIHEYRMLALYLMVHKFEREKVEEERTKLIELYLLNLDYVNNWDLVDASAPKLLGPYLLKRDRELLYRLASSGHLWRERVAVMTTLYFIRYNDFEDCLKLCEKFLNHEHDLIHKATGWMLREIGKRSLETEKEFLESHAARMPRTMLRYAIEKFPAAQKKYYMAMK